MKFKTLDKVEDRKRRFPLYYFLVAYTINVENVLVLQP